MNPRERSFAQGALARVGALFHPNVPPLPGLLPFEPNRLVPDTIAGITLAALGIPEVMGYATIAGMPLASGLYTLLLPIIAFALLGGSRHLVVAADSATAAILASMLVPVAALGSPAYVGLTSLVALAVAGMLLLARVFKLGFLADFLSRSALIGFLTGVGVQVAGGELAGLFGLPRQGNSALAQIGSALMRLGSTHFATLGISAAVLALVVCAARLAPRYPGALIAVICSIAASAAFNFAGKGIATIGNVPGGLPALSLPALNVSGIHNVLACAASCFVVILAQSAATARAYALRYGEQFTENRDLIGLAGANAAAALSGTFVVNGSPTKTEMVDEAGGRSQFAHLTTAVVVLLVLLFLTRPLGFLPSAVLSAIVFLIGVKLIDAKGMRELFRLQRNEFWIALLVAATVVVFTVIYGIAVAVVLSLIEQMRRGYRPRTRVLVTDDAGQLESVPALPGRFAAPGVIVYRFEADLFYANANLFMKQILHLVAAAEQPVRAVVVDASGIDAVDYSAAKMLVEVREQLERRGVTLSVFAALDGVLDTLRRYGLADVRAYPTVDAALAHWARPAGGANV